MYRIDVRPRAKEAIDALPPILRRRVLLAIEQLAGEPRPSGVRKLEGRDEYRIRVGDYRVMYEIEDAVLIVVVLRVAHRRGAYR